MNKKTILGLAALMLSIGGTVFAQTMVTLDQAIGYSANEIESRLEPGARVMVLNFRSSSSRLSTYVLDEMTTALTRSGRLTTVDRTNLDFLLRELRYERSGDINDEAAQSIGRILGAQYVVSGVIEEAASNFVVQFKTLPVEPVALQTLTRVGVVRDNQVTNLLSGDTTSQPRAGSTGQTGTGASNGASGASGQPRAGASSQAGFGASDSSNLLTLSAGAGAFGRLEFYSYSESQAGTSIRVETTTTSFGTPLFLNAEFFSYALLELSTYYQHRSQTYVDWEGKNKTESDNTIGASFSLFGQYPIRLIDRLTLFPLLGIGYDMTFYLWDKDVSATRSKSSDNDGNEGEGISNYLDFLSLKPGVRLNYSLNDNLTLNARFIWDFVLYNRQIAEERKDAGANATIIVHAPSLFIGASYTFLRF